MSEKKNIDRLFQERLKDFEAKPNPVVWERINQSLGHKKKRRLIPIWWRIGGVAATIALLVTIGSFVFTNETKNVLPVVNTDTGIEKGDTNTTSDKTPSSTPFSAVKFKEMENVVETTNQPSTSDSNYKNHKPNNAINTASTGNVLTSSVKKSAAVDPQKTKVDLSESAKISTKNNLNPSDISDSNRTSNNPLINQSKSDGVTVTINDSTNNNEENSITEPQNKENEPITSAATIEAAIAEANTINEKEKENQNRWSIAPNVAPVYYSSLRRGSAIGSQFNNNNSGSDINMSYGLKGSFALSNSLKIRAGINKVDLNYSTQDVIVYSGDDAVARGVSGQENNITFNPELPAVTILSRTIINSASAPEIVNTKYNGALDQRFSYIEIPLELEYNLIDTSINLNFIGGFSALFLNSNEIYADIEGTNTLIGQSNNINSTSYTANFGIGLSYGISEQLNINLEPTFKYQINGFNNTSGDFQPFFVGLYSGISFKF